MKLKIVEPRELLEFALARNLLDGAPPQGAVKDIVPPTEVHSARASMQLAPMEVENRPGFVLRLPEATVTTPLAVIYEGFLLPGGVAHSLGWIEGRYHRTHDGWCELAPLERVDVAEVGLCMLGVLFHWGHFFVDVLDRLLLLRRRGWLGRQLVTDPGPDCANALALARKAGIAPGGSLFRASPLRDYRVRDLILPTLESSKPAISASSFQELRQRVVPDSAAPRDAMLFVGRKDVRYRYVVTQESIVAYLGKSRNWEAIFPEFMTIDQAIGRFSSAAAIILPVGSAKFNLIFCRPGTHVVCVMPAGYAEGNMGVTGMIRHMCHALGLKLDFYSCAIERNPQVLLHSNLLISKDDLLRMLDLIDARRR